MRGRKHLQHVPDQIVTRDLDHTTLEVKCLSIEPSVMVITIPKFVVPENHTDG